MPALRAWGPGRRKSVKENDMPADALPSAPSAPARPPHGARSARFACWRRSGASSRTRSGFYGLLARDSVALVERHTPAGREPGRGRRRRRAVTSPTRSASTAPGACWSSRTPPSCTPAAPPGARA